MSVQEFGTCQDTNCSYYHNIRICEPCGIVVSSPHTYDAHLNGKRHKKNISKASNPLVYCQLCCCTLPQNGWEDHVSGVRHAGRANVTAGSWDEPEDIPGYQYCDLCHRSVPQRQWDQHAVGMQHQRAVRFAALRVALEETEREKQGIVIEGTAEFGVVDSDDAEEGCELVLHLKATAPGCKISWIHVRLSSSTDQVSRSAGDGAFTVAINGRQTMTMGSLIKIRIILRTAFIGHYSDRIQFTFRDLQLSSRFAIVRPIKAIVGNKAEFQHLQPTTPYAPRARTARPQAKEIVEGLAPPETQIINSIVPLPKASLFNPLLHNWAGYSSTSTSFFVEV
ncbi:hypothetical protein AX16_006137 [Volvariella volvacea WC 439]|nr:hypothetical protein AX16_006137 [Volvariella volvacea WC 439]